MSAPVADGGITMSEPHDTLPDGPFGALVHRHLDGEATPDESARLRRERDARPARAREADAFAEIDDLARQTAPTSRASEGFTGRVLAACGLPEAAATPPENETPATSPAPIATPVPSLAAAPSLARPHAPSKAWRDAVVAAAAVSVGLGLGLVSSSGSDDDSDAHRAATLAEAAIAPAAPTAVIEIAAADPQVERAGSMLPAPAPVGEEIERSADALVASVDGVLAPSADIGLSETAPELLASAEVDRLVPVVFRWQGAAASEVTIVGDFSAWEEVGLERTTDTDGTVVFARTMHLPPGRYNYVFVVDGDRRLDPDAPRLDGGFGENSLIHVSPGF